MKWINKNTPLLLLILGSLTLIFGVAGHLGSIATPRPTSSLGPSIHDWTNAFLTALSHFALEGFEPPDGSDLDWTSYALTASRVFAAAVVIIGATNLLASITNDFGRLHFWWRTRFGRDLDLIIGLGWHGKELIEHIESQRGTPGWVGGSKTLAIDSNPSESMFELCKNADVICLKSDIRSRSAFENLNLKNFKRVYLVMGSDESHVQILRLLSTMVNEEHRLVCHVGINSSSLYEGLLESKEWCRGLDIRTFNDAEITSQMLFQQRSLVHTFNKDVKSSRLIMLGHGKLFESILQQWLQNQIIEPSIDIDIDIFHPNALEAVKRFTDLYPCFKIHQHENDGGMRASPKTPVWASEKILPEIRFHQLPVSQALQTKQIDDLLLEENRINRTILAIITDEVEDSVRIARAVLPTVNYFSSSQNFNPKPSFIDSWVYLNTQDIDLFSQIGNVLKAYHSKTFVFRDYLGECSKSSLSNDIVERAAMAVHASFSGLEADPEKLWFGNIESENLPKPATLWDKESSRLCGAHAWVKKGILQRFSVDKQPFSFQDLPPLLIDEMAKIEHRRWCAVHLLRGWMPLVDLSSESFNAHDQFLIKSWYEDPESKFMYRQRFKHVCLVSFLNLERLEKFMQKSGKFISERKKDERIIRSTDRILKFSELSSD